MQPARCPSKATDPNRSPELGIGWGTDPHGIGSGIGRARRPRVRHRTGDLGPIPRGSVAGIGATACPNRSTDPTDPRAYRRGVGSVGGDDPRTLNDSGHAEAGR